jgi:hypothetical protein
MISTVRDGRVAVAEGLGVLSAFLTVSDILLSEFNEFLGAYT